MRKVFVAFVMFLFLGCKIRDGIYFAIEKAEAIENGETMRIVVPSAGDEVRVLCASDARIYTRKKVSKERYDTFYIDTSYLKFCNPTYDMIIITAALKGEELKTVLDISHKSGQSISSGFILCKDVCYSSSVVDSTAVLAADYLFRRDTLIINAHGKLHLTKTFERKYFAPFSSSAYFDTIIVYPDEDTLVYWYDKDGSGSYTNEDIYGLIIRGGGVSVVVKSLKINGLRMVRGW